MKKEWLYQLVALVIFYLNSIIFVEHEGFTFSDTPGINLLFILYQTLLYLLVNYILIPTFFNTKKYLLFFIAVIVAIALFGIVEEGFVEKILTPDSKGANDVTWQSIYWYYGEIIVPLLTFMTIKFVFDGFAQQQKLERIEQDRLSNELKLLKSQIQPHILFNSLNNLYHFALKKSDEVPALILKLSNVLRYVLYETTEERVPLAKELDFIKDYIDLQEIQYEGRGVIHYEIQNHPNNKNRKVVPFLLIPFIENSFKHSFGSKIEEVFINIKITIHNKQLQLFVENNYEEDNGNRDKLIQGGIGLVNVKKRLQLLYPNQHDLTISKEEQKYIVNLSVELT